MKATHDLDILLQEGAQMTDKRVSMKKGKQFVGSVDDLLRRSQKNQGGKVTIQTLRHLQRLMNAIDSKFNKVYVNGKPSSLLFSYVAWAVFEGSYDLDKGDTFWSYIKDSFKFPKNGEYFTVHRSSVVCWTTRRTKGGFSMSKTFSSDDAREFKSYKGGMYVRTDLGKTFTKWIEKGVNIVGVVIDDSNEVEFIFEEEE